MSHYGSDSLTYQSHKRQYKTPEIDFQHQEVPNFISLILFPKHILFCSNKIVLGSWVKKCSRFTTSSALQHFNPMHFTLRLVTTMHNPKVFIPLLLYSGNPIFMNSTDTADMQSTPLLTHIFTVSRLLTYLFLWLSELVKGLCI